MKPLNKKDRLNTESTLIQLVSVLGIVSIVTGLLITLFSASFAPWLQINIIGHSIVSAIAALPVALYLYYHFRRTTGIRKPGVLFSGLLSTALFIGLFGSGFWMVSKGQQEAYSIIPKLHAVLTYFAIAITALHIALHWLGKKRERSKGDRSFITFSTLPLGKNVANSLIIYGLTVFVLALSYHYLYTPPSQEIPENYQADYGDHPFRPSQTETDNNQLIHVNQIAKSAQCGSCHSDIYQQWLSSAHRQAASDPAYVKNINLLESTKGIVATRYCEGCHAPVALLTGELTEGGEHGGIPNTPAHLDGVGCMACHGISNIEHIDGTASYRFSPKEHYLFDSSGSMVGQGLRNFLIRAHPQKHKMAMNDQAVLQDPKLCASCHEQFMDKSMNDWGWVKMQNIYSSWLASPFSGQDNQIHSDANIMRCQDCHFAQVEAEDPSANSDGFVASHRSLGANTILPMLNGDTEHLELTKQFLQSAKLLVSIDEPSRRDTLFSEQFVDQSIRPSNQDNTPYFLYLGESSEITVTVTNRLVGHSFPAGTNDINEAWLYFTVRDANGREVYASGDLNDDLSLKEGAHTYHTIPVDRNGKEVWKHDLFRMTGEVYKNVIEAGRSDINSYEFTVPSWAKSPLSVEAILKYRKFNQRYAQWALDMERPEIPIIEMARDRLTIPLKNKVRATNAESNLP